MEYIHGTTFGDLLLENRNQAEYYMNFSFDIQLKLHEKTVQGLESMTLKLRRQMETVSLLSVPQKSKLIARLDSIVYDPKLCHGDFHLFNVLMQDNDKAVIIYWVDSSVGDVRADVYRTYLLYSQNYQDLADMYLQQYCRKSKLSPEEIMQWAPIIADARLEENVSLENIERLLAIVHNGI